MEKKVFRSRTSVTSLILWGLFLGGIACKFSGALGGYHNPVTYGLIGFYAFKIMVCQMSRYVLTDKEIQIHYVWGKPSRYKILISGIISARRSYNLIGACSYKLIRFNVKESRKRHYINLWGSSTPSVAPVREQDFLEALKAINPNIQINVTDKKGLWWRFWGWDF